MFAGKEQGVLLIRRDGIDCVFDGSGVITFPFDPAAVADLDVVDKEVFATAFGTFIDTNKIIPTSFVMVLDDSVLFEKDFAIAKPVPAAQSKDGSKTPLNSQVMLQQGNEEKQKIESEIQKYLAYVPLETIVARKYTTATGVHVAAANKELLDCVRNAFIGKGSAFISVVPRFIFGDQLQPASVLTREAAHGVLKKSEFAKQNSMFEEDQQIVRVERNDHSTREKVKKVMKNKRLYIFLVFFLLLLAVLGVVIYNSSKEDQIEQAAIKKSTAHSKSPVTLPSPANVLLAPTISASSSAVLSQLKIKISYPASVSTLVHTLKTGLGVLGFTTVQIEVITSATGKSLVIFAPSVPPATREQILREVKKSFPYIGTQEGASGATDVSIVIST